MLRICATLLLSLYNRDSYRYEVLLRMAAKNMKVVPCLHTESEKNVKHAVLLIERCEAKSFIRYKRSNAPSLDRKMSATHLSVPNYTFFEALRR